MVPLGTEHSKSSKTSYVPSTVMFLWIWAGDWGPNFIEATIVSGNKVGTEYQRLSGFMEAVLVITQMEETSCATQISVTLSVCWSFKKTFTLGLERRLRT